MCTITEKLTDELWWNFWLDSCWVKKAVINFNKLIIWPQVTDDIRESAFLYQRLSVLIQCYNAVAIQGTFAHTTAEDEF